MADGGKDIARNWTFFRVVAGILILTLLWRALIPAREYPGRSAQMLTIVIDLGLLVGLFGIRAHLVKVLDMNDPRRKTLTPLFGAALICGVCLFLIRLTGDAAWWTGHLLYSIY